MNQIEVDWQAKCPAKDRALFLLRTGLWSDCKFLVGRNDKDKVYINAHKLVLASASRVFEAMFYGAMAEKKEIIEITDIEPDAFKDMLTYIYSDAIDVSTLNGAISLYYCADKYNLRKLTEGCVKFLAANISPENVCHIYEFAKLFNEYQLMHKTVKVIQGQTTDVLQSESFLYAKMTTVTEIFSHSILNLKSEIELFDAAERYANAQGEVKPMFKGSRKRKLPPVEGLGIEVEETEESESSSSSSDSSSDSSDGISEPSRNTSRRNVAVIDEKKKEVFRKILPTILILTLTPRQFANRISKSPYLTKDECYGLLMNIVSDTSYVPVPAGFNTQRRPRYKLITEPKCYTDLSTEKSSARTEAVFTVAVPKFRKTKQISLPFYVRNILWRVAVDPQPRINEPKQKSLGIYVMMSMPPKLNVTCSAAIEIGVHHKNSNTHRVLKKTNINSNKSSTVGAIISLTDDLFDPKKGFILNNTIKLHISIKIAKT